MCSSDLVTVPAALPHVQAGRIRALAVGSPKRAAALPDLPTVSEAGLPGYDVSAWNGILLPARTPAAIVARLNGEIAKFAHAREQQERAIAQGSDLVSNSPAEFVAYLKAQMAKWSKVVREAGVRAD